MTKRKKVVKLPNPKRFGARLGALPTSDPDTPEARTERCLNEGAEWIRKALAESGEEYVLKGLRKAGLDIGPVRLRRWLQEHPGK